MKTLTQFKKDLLTAKSKGTIITTLYHRKNELEINLGERKVNKVQSNMIGFDYIGKDEKMHTSWLMIPKSKDLNYRDNKAIIYIGSNLILTYIFNW